MSKIIAIAMVTVVAWVSPVMAEVESWYSYWGVGVSDNSYGDELDDALDNAESQSGVDRTQVAVDMLGFYFPMSNEKTVVGAVINATGDRVDVGNENLQLTRTMYSLSAMHFFGKEPGDGFYLRGDAGIAKMSVTTSDGEISSSESGTGLLIGAGFGLPLSAESRLLLGVNFSSANIEEETVSAMMFTVGGLW